jgi:hypothetical protein
MNRAQRNCNPGNLRWARQREGIGPDPDGFAIFPTDLKGWTALVTQIGLDQKRGDSFKTFLDGYAPASENDVGRYVDVLTSALRTKPEEKLSSYSPYAIAGVIALHEGYFNKEAK